MTTRLDFGNPHEVSEAYQQLVPGPPPSPQVVQAFVQVPPDLVVSHCEVGISLAHRLGMGAPVQAALGQIFFTLGHSRGVAELAEDAARSAGLPPADIQTLHRAALFHDLGRVGVPNGIWEKAGPLSAIDWESVRLHPYHTERILSRAPALRSLALMAGMHYERQNGSGYFRIREPGA